MKLALATLLVGSAAAFAPAPVAFKSTTALDDNIRGPTEKSGELRFGWDGTTALGGAVEVAKQRKKNSYYNCKNGPDCGNRQLGRRKFAKCKPKREQGMGWGLVTVNSVKKNELVQEYVGEIIDGKTKIERMNNWAQSHLNDPNFYVMSLESGWYIDAREKGNQSRFINHSCDPNCLLVPLNVDGHTKVAIIANKNINPGEFLKYDYQFDTKGSDKFNCRCGAKNCRGTIKGGKMELP